MAELIFYVQYQKKIEKILKPVGICSAEELILEVVEE